MIIYVVSFRCRLYVMLNVYWGTTTRENGKEPEKQSGATRHRTETVTKKKIRRETHTHRENERRSTCIYVNIHVRNNSSRDYRSRRHRETDETNEGKTEVKRIQRGLD